MDTATTDRNTIGAECLNAAIDYRQRGWSPIALCPPDHVGVGRHHDCNTPGKTPLEKWKHLQTAPADEREIRRWWRQQANGTVGLALGAGSGLVRVDIEDEAGHREIIDRYGDDALPPTIEFLRDDGPDEFLPSESQSRGLLYAIPSDIDPATIRKVDHVRQGHTGWEILGTGQYTVMPPSLHASGGRYRWVAGHSPDDIDPAPMPEWMIDAMRRPERPAVASTPTDVPDATRRRAIAAMWESDPDMGHDDWFAIVAASHNLDPSDSMMQQVIAWSSMGRKFVPGEIERRWPTLGDCDRPVTIRSVFCIDPDDDAEDALLATARPSPVPSSNGEAAATNGNPDRLHDERMGYVRTILPLPDSVERIIQWGETAPTYDLQLASGKRVSLGTIKQLSRPKDVRLQILATTHTAIESMTPKSWERVVTILVQCAEVRPMDDAWPIRDWLDELEERHPVENRHPVGSDDWWREAIRDVESSTGQVIRTPDGVRHVRAVGLHFHLMWQGERFSLSELRAALRRAGYEPHKLQRRIGDEVRQVRTWRNLDEPRRPPS